MPDPTNVTGRDLVASQMQSLVKIEGIPGYWATKSGGETSAEVTDVPDGGRKTPEKVGGVATTDNITLTRPYRPTRDIAVLKRLRPQVGAMRATVTDQPTDADLVPQGPPTVYSGALLVRMADPEYDAGSSDAKMMELEFAVESVA